MSGSAQYSPTGTGGVTVGAIIDGTGASTTDPLTIINGKNGSGIIIKASGSFASGVVFQNSSAAQKGAVGVAISNGDWVTSSLAGDIVLTAGSGSDSTRIFIKPGGSNGATVIRSPGNNGLIQVDDLSGIQIGFAGKTATFTSVACTYEDAPFIASRITNGIIATSGNTQSIKTQCVFFPSSGTATYQNLDLTYTINQTGGANGTVTGISLVATETAVVGTHNLIDLKIGATSKFTVDNSGLMNTGLAVVALGGGAAPTLGTIGGSGPATAAQNSWWKVKHAGTVGYIPVWR